MNFTTTLVIERYLYYLTFSPVYTFDAYKLFVRALSPDRDVVCFEMKKDTLGQWQISLPAPEWAIKYKKDLTNLIMRNC